MWNQNSRRQFQSSVPPDVWQRPRADTNNRFSSPHPYHQNSFIPVSTMNHLNTYTHECTATYQNISVSNVTHLNNLPPVSSMAHRRTIPVSRVAQKNDSNPLSFSLPKDVDFRNSYPFDKNYAGQQIGDSRASPLSGISRACGSPDFENYRPHSQGKTSVPSAESFKKTVLPKSNMSIVNKTFAIKSSHPPQSPFNSERKSFNEIPFISDITVENSPKHLHFSPIVSSVTKQEEDSLDYYYNRHSPSKGSHESSTVCSFDKQSSLPDHLGFSQRSNDSFIFEENHCEVNEDSQSISSFPVEFSEDIHGKETPPGHFSEDNHNELGGSVGSLSKRQKLDHDSPGIQSELEKLISELEDAVVGLDYIIEFKKENVPASHYTYKCTLCNSSILAKQVLMHILNVKHRLRYLKTKNEVEHQRIMKLRANQNELAKIVAERAEELEKHYGRGSVKVISDSASEAKSNEEKNILENPFTISPSSSTPKILPPGEEPLLDKIPEPPDLKLLNEILTAAQTLKTGASNEGFQFPSQSKAEELSKNERLVFEARNSGSKWPLDCEIPSPPLISFAESPASPWGDHLPTSETSASSPVSIPLCNISDISANIQPSSVSPAEMSKLEIPEEKYSLSVNKNDSFVASLCDKNENAEVNSPKFKTSEASDVPNRRDSLLGSSQSTENGSTNKHDSIPDCESKEFAKIPLLGDSVNYGIDKDNSKSPAGSPFSNTCSAPNSTPNKESSCENLKEKDTADEKTACYELLLKCSITNEEEADFVRGMIATLTQLYLSYKLRNLPSDESGSLVQALCSGDKEAITKLASHLHQTTACTSHLTDDEKNSNMLDNLDAKQDHIIDSCINTFSPLRTIKIPEHEQVNTAELDSQQKVPSSKDNDSELSVPTFLLSHGSDQQVNAQSSVLDSHSIVSSDANVTHSPSCIAPLKEVSDDKQAGDFASQKEKDDVSDVLKFSFLPPPPPPPPPEIDSVPQSTSQDQPSYSQSSESSTQMTSYSGWPVTYYPGTAQASSYIYWPTQNLTGVDPTGAQYVVQAQNSEAGLFSWCSQPTAPPEDASPPPLPPPPPPPPPPPSTS